MMRTYQSRPRLTIESEVALAAYAARYSRSERCLFSHLSAGEDAGKLKASFMRKHGLTARQFNALAFSVKGKIKSLIEGRNKLIADLKERISGLEYRLSEKLKPGTNKYHQKRRKLAALRGRLAGLEEDRKSGRMRMCFGGRRLFRAQFNLEENGYRDHAAWKHEWEKARSREVFVIGSKDETAGCQGCQLVPVGDGLFSVKLRLIGRNKFARRYGLSSHGAAALVIARRALKLSERPNPHSDHNTSPVPVRKRGEHVWSYWAKVLRRERRLQRPVGRSERAIQSVPRGTGRTQPAGPGAIPGRQSAGNTVRPASTNEVAIVSG